LVLIGVAILELHLHLEVTGAVFVAGGIALIFRALYMYYFRLNLILKRGNLPFYDKLTPALLAILFLSGLIILAVRKGHVFDYFGSPGNAVESPEVAVPPSPAITQIPPNPVVPGPNSLRPLTSRSEGPSEIAGESADTPGHRKRDGPGAVDTGRDRRGRPGNQRDRSPRSANFNVVALPEASLTPNLKGAWTLLALLGLSAPFILVFVISSVRLVHLPAVEMNFTAARFPPAEEATECDNLLPKLKPDFTSYGSV